MPPSAPSSSSSPAAPPSPEPLFEMAVAYWRSCALFSAIDLRLFEALAAPPTLEELSERTGTPARSLSMLLDALAALELVQRDGDRWRNRPVAHAFLVPGTPGYLGETIAFNARSYAAWGKLTEAVRSARPPVSTTHFLGDDPDATTNFVLAMHQRALGVARCLVDMLDLSGRRHLLDIGGGPATYSRLLAERNPDLQCTVLDLPGILDVADRILADSPARARVALRPGDMFTDDFGTGFDVVLFSGVLHRTEGQSTVEMFRKAAAALEPGGMVAVSDLFTGGDNRGPVLPELFSLHMMLTAHQGQSLPLPEMKTMLAEAGLQLIETRPYPSPLPHLLCIATK